LAANYAFGLAYKLDMKDFFGKALLVLAAFLFLVGIFLRVWRVDKAPVSLFGDEIDVGLQANSILTTGKDYFGNALPIMFHSFSEYRLPLQLYMDVPSIGIFGLNEIGVRVPAVVMGFLSIFALYLLVNELFGRRLAIITALFLTLSPWHFMFSRQANDAGILLPFVLLGTYFFVKGTKKYRYLFASAILFSLGIYAYAIASLFIPLFVLFMAAVYRKQIFGYGLKRLVLVFLLSLLVLSPYIKQSFSGLASQRFSYISVANKEEIRAELDVTREASNSSLSRIFNNKLTITFDKILKNYSRAFSFSFLFWEGDPNPRQSVGGFGHFYHFDLLLILLALWILVSNYSKSSPDRKKVFQVLLIWLVLAPIPSALTRDGGTHASRLILMLPPLIVFSALGFETILGRLKDNKEKLVAGTLLLFMLFEMTRFLYSYFVAWPMESWRAWQYGYKEVGLYLRANSNKYERVLLNNTYEPMLPRFLFWYGYDMNDFQETFKDDKHIDSIYPNFNGFKLGDKFYFGELVKRIEVLASKENLVVASTENDVTDPYIFDNPELLLLDIVYSPTRKPIFYIYSGQ